MAAPLIRTGEKKKPVLWERWQSVGALRRSSTPGSTHTALFCIHLLSSAFRQAAAFPGLLAAQPALLWQGEDGCCGVGEAGVTFPLLGRAVVMAVLLQAWSAGGAGAFS